MSSAGNDGKLLQAVFNRNFQGVKRLFEAGASVDGHPEAHCPPIAAATIVNDVAMVEYFLQHGADPDRPVTIDRAWITSRIATAVPGERALHIAARHGKVEILRLLLHRSHADPNATDTEGCTPLNATCSYLCVNVEVVRLLLDAGANPALAEYTGILPLHMAALLGNVDLIDMLYSNAPATLNRGSSNGKTALFEACNAGHEDTVSKLLSLGAMQPVSSDYSKQGALEAAVHHGFVGVVRILINEGGVRAVGGETAMRHACDVAIRYRRARILRLLLTVDGEEGRSKWANSNLEGTHLLHSGASVCYSAAVSILLEAGADEAARHSDGRIPRDVIGLYPALEVRADSWEVVAIKRMLQRGPAYRARSWAWPSNEESHACGSGEDGAAAAGGGDGAILSSPSAAKPPPDIGVRIFRPKENGSRKIFVSLIGRYCAKD